MDRLNKFYACFDDKAISMEQQARREELLNSAKDYKHITIGEDEIIKVLNKISVRKASDPYKIRALLLKKVLKQPLIYCPLHFPINRVCSPFHNVHYDMSENSDQCIIIKYAKHTIVIGLITPVCFLTWQKYSWWYQHPIIQHLDKSTPHYTRCSFINYSSIFNTMQPPLLLGKL